MGKTLFKLVYGQEAVIPMEYIVSSLHIDVTTRMDDDVVLEERSTIDTTQRRPFHCGFPLAH